MKEKIEIVNRMVEKGYHLFDETPEHFAGRFDVQTLRIFEQAFEDAKNKK